MLKKISLSSVVEILPQDQPIEVKCAGTKEVLSFDNNQEFAQWVGSTHGAITHSLFVYHLRAKECGTLHLGIGCNSMCYDEYAELHLKTEDAPLVFHHSNGLDYRVIMHKNPYTIVQQVGGASPDRYYLVSGLRFFPLVNEWGWDQGLDYTYNPVSICEKFAEYCNEWEG